LAILFAVCWILSAIHPVDMGVWLLENVLTLQAVLWVWFTRRLLPLSDLSYFLIAAFLLMHEVGAHYTYELVPIGFWIKPWFGLVRNDWDRIVHFAFGFLLVVPCYESLRRFFNGPPWLVWLAPSILIAGMSAFYEIAEAYANLVLAPYTAAAYLSLQGDPFDSQNDMAMAVAGSMLAMTIAALAQRRGTLSWQA
jgi:putative membrane protein